MNPLTINFLFDPEDYKKLQHGYDFGKNMDHKWHIYLKDDWLYLDRSWKDWCAYRLRLRKLEQNYFVTEAETGFDVQSEDSTTTARAFNNWHLLMLASLLESHIFNTHNDISGLLGGSVFRDTVTLDLNSIHGINHWRKVEKIGKRLSNLTGADNKVVALFAYVHDCCRVNDDEDPKHGQRAAQAATNLLKDAEIQLSELQLKQLLFACEHHSNKHAASSDITIQTCWDADRLDLLRIGITPDARFLYTEVAKKEDILKYSKNLNSLTP